MWNLLLYMVFDTISYGYLSVRKDYHMNTHNQKHLTVSDRLYIEQELLQGTSFKTIAQVLHKDPTTISKEIKRARTLIPRDRFVHNAGFVISIAPVPAKTYATK